MRGTQRILVAVFVFNEGEKLRDTLMRFPEARPYDIIIIDDGSTDESARIADESGYRVLRHATNRGVGAALRTVIEFALENQYEVLVPIAGNAKMFPSDIPGLLRPILEEGFDYVQGSRYLPGGASTNLPLYRRVGIPVFTWMVGLIVGRRFTDATCGMRAYRLSILRHPKLNIGQPWLDRYELEYYIHFYAVKLGFRVTEAPVTMAYPTEGRDYSKIPTLTGWWSMIRPWVFLAFRLRK